MKKIVCKLLPIATAAALSTALVAAPAAKDAANKDAASKDSLIASGKLELDKKIADKAKGIRTLFISLYDPASPMPRPFAATKIELTKDATSGSFQEFKLTPENVMAMSQGPMPQTMRIKAKLDKDGNAGPDTSGDVTGTIDNVKAGTSNVVIKLDTFVN